MRCAISVVQSKYISLAEHNLEDLIDIYHAALQQAYDKYLRKEITFEEQDTMKVLSFFAELSLPEPMGGEIKQFRNIYEQTHKENRRATQGGKEVLVRL
jgi:hypothetical protein